jgi:hypothetical protein
MAAGRVTGGFLKGFPGAAHRPRYCSARLEVDDGQRVDGALMFHLRIVPLVLLFPLSWPISAYSQASDCEALRSSTIPYQITTETHEVMDGVPLKSTSISQVYRDASGIKTVYDVGGSLSMGRFTGQTPLGSKRLSAGIFLLELHNRNGVTKYEYSGIDPKTFDYETKSVQYKTRAASVAYNFVERGTAVVGPCRFSTIRFKEHYVWDKGIPHATDYTVTKEYSPELQSILWFRQDRIRNGKPYEYTLRTLDLTTKFRPVR